MALMTTDVLQAACVQNGGYRQPHLNDQLYLQCKGFVEMASLDEYTELKALWLDQNGIGRIQGVGRLAKLASLFLQNNALGTTLGLGGLTNLRTLNLSHNHIGRLEGVAECCPLLETLQVSHNRIESLGDVGELTEMRELTCVDVSFNVMEHQEGAPRDPMMIVKFFQRVPKLAVLYAHGQELTRTTRHYRKSMVLHLPGLTYLDEKPVFPAERRATEAWGRGGPEAEREELRLMREERENEMRAQTQALTARYEAGRAEREARQRAWEVKQETERQATAARRLEQKRQRTEHDHEEYAARGQAEAEEETRFTALLEMAAAGAADADGRAAERRRSEEVETTARAEIEAERKRIEAAAAAERRRQQERFDELSFWSKQLTAADEEAESSAMREFDAMLATLQPGRPSEDLSSPADSPVPFGTDDAAVQRHVDTTAQEQAIVASVTRRPPAGSGGRRRRWDGGSSLWQRWTIATSNIPRPEVSKEN